MIVKCDLNNEDIKILIGTFAITLEQSDIGWNILMKHARMHSW